ncbi:TlpA family protein disulfide reductase [Terrimonas alba]|uniref:TlpA family protein disulfide reductase n=1 Tax=Terrimonas alba TaxID=3349636 RepID=UPI0035F27C84
MNYKKIYSYLLIAITLSGPTSFAQRLDIGDQLPNIQLANVINHSSTTLDLGSINKKLIILNFWATTCYACIDEFPRLDSLQRKYGDQIQIIAINPESKDSILRFFTRFKKLRIPSIPFVTGDTIMAKHFPHHGVPYHVWADSTKKINFTTFGWNANSRAIEQYLLGRKLQLSTIRYSDTMFIETSLKSPLSDNIMFHSLLTRWIPGISVGNATYVNNETNYPYRIKRSNSSILSLFIDAFSEGGRYNFQSRNAIQLRNVPLEIVDYPADIYLFDDWKKEYCYNYDLQVPPKDTEKIYRYMQQDLIRYFDINAAVITNKIDCWVIARTSKKDKIRSKGQASKYNHQGIHRDSLFYYHNMPMTSFIGGLQDLLVYREIPFPLVDETGYTGNVDIGLSLYTDKNMTLEALRKDLKKYDLAIIQRKIAIPTLVLQKR